MQLRYVKIMSTCVLGNCHYKSTLCQKSRQSRLRWFSNLQCNSLCCKCIQNGQESAEKFSEPFPICTIPLYLSARDVLLHSSEANVGQILKGGNRNQYIVSPHRRTSNRIVKCDIPLLVQARPNFATVACQYSVGVWRRGVIVLSSGRHANLVTPLFVDPRFQLARY